MNKTTKQYKKDEAAFYRFLVSIYPDKLNLRKWYNPMRLFMGDLKRKRLEVEE